MKTLARGAALAAALLLAAPAGAKLPEADLDETAWKLLLEEANVPDGLAHTNLLVFRRGRFADLEGLGLGFRPSAYVAVQEAGRMRWWASLPRPDGSIASWSGLREGRRMTGTLRWTLPSGRALELRWRAVLRPVPAAAPEF